MKRRNTFFPVLGDEAVKLTREAFSHHTTIWQVSQ
jgi:hypothetical protein